MPLFIQREEIDLINTTAELFDKYPHLQENAKTFCCRPRVDVDPKCLLYVQQREFAATTPADCSVSVIGSDDATTCHLVVLRHSGSGAVCLAHCDGSNTLSEVSMFMKAVASLSSTCKDGRFELHLVGGFKDDLETSHKLSLNILAAFQEQKEDVHLETCCITEMNDTIDKETHRPIVYGIGVNVKTGDVFPASFTHRGPAEELRSARTFTGGLGEQRGSPGVLEFLVPDHNNRFFGTLKMADVYDPCRGLVKIGPCKWSRTLNFAFWLSQSDDIILKYLSTSPKAEPPHFVKHIKSTIQFLLEHPDSDSLFPGGQPQFYHRAQTGGWERFVQS